MNHTIAEEDLKVISGLLEEWKRQGSVGELEYDLLLDKIKNLYETVRFGKEVSAPRETVVHESVAAQVEGSEATSDTPAPVREEKGATGSEPRVRLHAGRSSTVRALYDDGEVFVAGTSHKYFVTESATDIVPDTPAAAEENGATRAERGGEDTAAAVVPPVVPVESKRPVLGEVIGGGGRTFADTLHGPVTDVATRLGHEKASSLRQLIGLNDRYMFVRDLFGGDAEAYEEAVSALDGCASIEDAMLYIHDRYGWNASSQAAVLLTDMLARKLL